jgi:hypothetical protein
MDDRRIGNPILIQPIEDTDDFPALLSNNNKTAKKSDENKKQIPKKQEKIETNFEEE